MCIVMVFEDPLTRQKPEGWAEILRRVGRPDPDLGQRCMVHFLEDSDGQVVTRWVRRVEAFHAVD